MGVFVQVEMETEFFSENDRLQLFLKEEKVGHNTLGWISIELLIRSILRIFTMKQPHQEEENHLEKLQAKFIND